MDLWLATGLIQKIESFGYRSCSNWFWKYALSSNLDQILAPKNKQKQNLIEG